MNESVVSYYTAEELKAVGFPQPIPQPGQTWYSGFGTKLAVKSPEDVKGLVGYTMEGKKANARTEHFLEGNIFAPTIEDIKSELLAVKAPVQHLGNDVEAFAKEWIRVFS